MSDNTSTIDKMLERQGYSKKQILDMYKEFVMGFDGSKVQSMGVTFVLDTTNYR